MRPVALLVACAAAASLVACSGDDAVVDPTAPLGLSNTVDTLFPPSRETIPVEEGTAPEGALFGGDLCAALTQADIDGVEFPTGTATLREFGLLAVDRCEFLIDAGQNTYQVLVQAVTPAEFAALVAGIDSAVTTPEGGPAVFEALDDLGLEAFGLDAGTEYRVWVQADTGYFQVIAPDRGSALVLAARAQLHAAG